MAEIESQELSVDSDIVTDSVETCNDEESLFEGCEKRLIINFSGDGDLRRLSCEEWSVLLEHAKCTILNDTSNDMFTAYLLSESSLFVYKDTIMIKTCGKTTVLNLIPELLDQCEKLRLLPVYVNYSRANYMFPDQQPKLYQKFENEVEYLNEFFDGSEAILGPLKGARWHVYVAGTLSTKDLMFDWSTNAILSDSALILEASDDSCGTPPPPNLGSPSHSSAPKIHRWPSDCIPPIIHSPASPIRNLPQMEVKHHSSSTLEIVMYDLSKDSMKCFFRDNLPSSLTSGISDFAEREEKLVNYVTKHSGIKSLIKAHALIDAFVFEPCGYSLNALHGSDYWTIHVTPEEAGSFVSFEQTSVDDCMDYIEIIKSVISLFKPDRFAVCVNSMNIEKVTSLSLSISSQFKQFTKKSCSTHEFEHSYIAFCANFVHKSLVFNSYQYGSIVSSAISYPIALISKQRQRRRRNTINENDEE